MAMQGVKIAPKGESKSVHPNEDPAKMAVLGLLYMTGSALDDYRRAVANGNHDRAVKTAVALMERAGQLWPHPYGTLQKCAGFVAEDLGFVLEEVPVSAGGTA